MRGRTLLARGKVFSLRGAVLLFAGMCLGLSAPVACGAIFSSGYVSPADPSSWTDATTAYIGDTASGALTVNGGSLLRSSTTYVSSGTATIEGDGTQWSSTGKITVGSKGRLDIRGGAVVVNSGGATGINYPTGEVNGGIVNIAGAGSRWSTDIMYVNSGTVNVTNGGTVSVTSGSGINVWDGNGSFNTSVVLIDGPGSIWNTNEVGMWVGTGSLKITGGGLLTTASTGISNQFSGVGWGFTSVYGRGDYYGMAKVDGAGSRWLNNSDLLVDCGVLSVSGGGAVTAASVSVAPGSVLAIDIGRGSSLVATGGSITTSSPWCIFRFLAGADAVSGTTTAPISASIWSGAAGYQAIGGTWNTSTHEFTVSSVQSGEAGTQVSIDPAVTQRVLVTDGATGNAVGLSYLAASTAGTVASVTATEIDSWPLSRLAGLIAPNQRTLDAWNFAFSGTVPTTAKPMYLSFDIGSGYASNDLEVWSYNGTNWTKYDAFDITSNGTWASFSITSAGGYAVVATVPEPGSVLLLMSALMMGLAALRRRGRLQGNKY